MFVLNDVETNLVDYIKLADDGSTKYQEKLGIYYWINFDLDNAEKYLELAANGGSVSAMVMLAYTMREKHNFLKKFLLFFLGCNTFVTVCVVKLYHKIKNDLKCKNRGAFNYVRRVRISSFERRAKKIDGVGEYC